jgi:demethylmenaquinone methyltransferase/2-methoxy-6-polyprenyl-1,4-benzoquinol methylase
MPFRAVFDCLWCGARHEVRAPGDLEGWAQLCPTCIGRAGDNEFLRFRLKRALDERATTPAEDLLTRRPEDGPQPDDAEILRRYYEARAPEYDDWYLRRGRYARGPLDDAPWQAELEGARRWLAALPIQGEILELAAGTGWWSTVLAGKGSLMLTDAVGATLDRARDRLATDGLEAEMLVRDAWAEPDRVVDALFTGFWLSHVRAEELPAFLALVRRWLRPGGTFAAIDSLADPASGAGDHPAPRAGTARRRLNDGREFEIVKVFHDPDRITATLLDAGFRQAETATTGRFFALVHATA